MGRAQNWMTALICVILGSGLQWKVAGRFRNTRNCIEILETQNFDIAEGTITSSPWRVTRANYMSRNTATANSASVA